MLEQFTLEPFSTGNVEELHGFLEENTELYSFPLKSFIGVTIEDPDFDPNLSIVAREKDSKSIVAAFQAIVRRLPINIKGREIGIHYTYLTVFAVKKEMRRNGIGSAMLREIIHRLKKKKRRKMRVLCSPPNYLWPGLDPRFTPALFFLKKNKFFRKKGEKVNLVYSIPENTKEPPSNIAGVTINRIKPIEIDHTIKFIETNHAGMWPVEFQYSLKNEPMTTFVAKNNAGEIVGFASHSIGFPGSFGPTGVSKNLRGKGIGGLLLKWCAWDLKNAGIEEMIIRWVVGDTIKFYSKSIGARIHQVYWSMLRRL
ncbi:MAG: GNAT family N-acetyltransferase [Promethearchaeota archaeon]